MDIIDTPGNPPDLFVARGDFLTREGFKRILDPTITQAYVSHENRQSTFTISIIILPNLKIVSSSIAH